MRNEKTKSIKILVGILKKHNADLRNKFKVKEIGVFGSYVRGEQKKSSDVDILVEFEPGQKTFDRYMELKFFLEEIFGLKVDLVIKTAIRDEIRRSILSEAVYA